VLATERITIPVRMPTGNADATSAMMLAVGALLHREVAIDELLDRMVDHIREQLDADRGTIYLLDRGTGQLVSKAAHLPELEEIRLALGQGVAGWVAQRGDVVNVPTTSSSAHFYQGVDEKTGYRTRSILAAPMRDRSGNILGVVQLLNKRGGAFPEKDAERLLDLAEQAALAVEATTFYQQLDRPPAPELTPLPIAANFNRIVGESDSLRAACRLTSRAANSEATVLVRGESGTGKELFARAIHVNSPRSDEPFVKVDCAALPESLIENELFGHERGAYTGAGERALGKFDAAQGGTIFLDEIGELPPSVQGKLLRVLQDREFLRVGGTKPVKVDVRVVAATNRNLEQLVSKGQFRGDLYFRIKVVELPLPPLRERGRKDVERLARHFLGTAAKKHRRPEPRLTASALDRLQRYPWPGNVRELENCIESAVVIMDGSQLLPEDLPLPDRPLDLGGTSSPVGMTPPSSRGRVRTLEEVEREHILRVLDRVDGNQTKAAKLLGIGRNTLGRKLRKFGL
jgi:Nif-specific regulatory protein